MNPMQSPNTGVGKKPYCHRLDGWIKNPKQNPPPENILVEVRGCDWIGDWTQKAMRKDYKNKPNHGGKRGWRWVGENGDRLKDQAVSEYRFLEV